MVSIAIEKRHIFLPVVFVLIVVSFLGDWVPAEKISFVSYSYFIVALNIIRCYLFSILTMGFLVLIKKNISIVSEFFIFLPVIAGGIFVLCGLPFNAIMSYSRIVTVVQVLVAIVLFGKSMMLFYESNANSEQNAESENKNAMLKMQDIELQSNHFDFSRLSKREKDIAELLLEGKKNDEIAETLFISVATVKTHIQHIFDKYQVRSRMEFANKIRKQSEN